MKHNIIYISIENIPNIRAVFSQHLDRSLTQIACTVCVRWYVVVGQNVLSTTQIRFQHGCPLIHIL